MANAATERNTPTAGPGKQPPAPPWASRSDRKPKTRVPLSQDAIVDAAMRILDAEGYDGLSMRRVASELGTGAASLYAHVANKDELLDLMIDRVAGEFEYPEPDPDNWQEQLKECLRSQRRIFQSHPGIARAMLGRIPLGPNALRTIEGFLAVANAGDLPDHVLGWSADVISLYVTAQVFEEEIQRTDKPDVRSIEEVYAWLGQMKDFIRSLPKDEFPVLTEKVDAVFEHGGEDGRFEFGLDLMIRGLATYSGTDDQGPAYEKSQPPVKENPAA
jgi:AcrR family transcriptional regulator